MILDRETSYWAEILRGVTQGSILGPLLFTVFVNDLPDITKHSTTNLYADDTTIYVSDKDPDVLTHKLNKGLQRIAERIERNGLRMKLCRKDTKT